MPKASLGKKVESCMEKKLLQLKITDKKYHYYGNPPSEASGAPPFNKGDFHK